MYEQDLLAILVGNATNQGTYGISQRSDRSYEQISTIQANYLRPETVEVANNRINNATARLPIFKHYNIQEDVIHASADGQKFEAKRDTFKTRYSSKYFGTQKGVSALSLIVNHAATNAKIICANEHESHYIFDLLFNNTSEIKPEVLSTDTPWREPRKLCVAGSVWLQLRAKVCPGRANYLLSYIDDAELRSHVQRALNRGEAYHQLRRAIIYFHSSVLSHLLKSFEYQKDEQKLAIVKQASPAVAWYNINLKGTYRFKSTGKVPDLEQIMRHIEGYRPVR